MMFLTLVHAVEDLVELFFCELTVMLFPALSGFTAQDHQLPLLPSQSREVRDLHNHRPDAELQERYSHKCLQFYRPLG